MVTLAELNKEERKLRGEIVKLRREFRDKEVSKKEFNEVFESLSDELEGISEKKSNLIGLPPMPPKPRDRKASSMPVPPKASPKGKPATEKTKEEDRPAEEGRFGLDSIKKSILGGFRDDPEEKNPGSKKVPDLPPIPKPKASTKPPMKKVSAKDLEPPAPPKPQKQSKKPVAQKAPPKPSKKAKPTKAPKKERVVRTETVKEKIEKVPVITERIKRIEVPVIKEVIKEVPVIKEVIKEVKVPVIKVKKVPVIKEVKVPAEPPEMAKKIEEVIKEMNMLKVDMSTSTKELSQLSDSMVDLSKRIMDVENVKADVRTLSSAMGKMDFQGLSQDLYNQFNTLKSFIKDSLKDNESVKSDPKLAEKVEENTQDLREIQSDFTRVEKEVTGFLDEIRDASKQVQEMAGLKGEIEELDARIKNIDFEGLTQEIYKQFEKMDSDISRSETKMNDFMEKMKVSLKTVEDKVEDASGAKEHVDNLDIANIRRDMESLKQKSQYIEKHIERVDLEPVMSLIRDVETKVETLRASSALIIE